MFRLDAVLMRGNQIRQIFDLKTGNAGMSMQRMQADLHGVAAGFDAANSHHSSMTKSELGKVAKQLATHFPSFRVKGSLLFLTPIGRTLRGLALERSSSRSGFYVWAFFQPLCVPAGHIYFNLGRRLGNGSRTWNVEEPFALDALERAIHREALPFLEPIVSSRDAALAAKLLDPEHDPATQRAVAYSFARAGDTPQALREIARFLRSTEQDTRPWAVTQVAEASRLKNLLSSDPTAAQAQLEQWESQTLKALGLEQFGS